MHAVRTLPISLTNESEGSPSPDEWDGPLPRLSRAPRPRRPRLLNRPDPHSTLSPFHAMSAQSLCGLDDHGPMNWRTPSSCSTSLS